MNRVLLAGVASLLSVAAQAAPIDATTSITNGGLTFNNFTCIATSPAGSSTNGNCSGLSVDAFGTTGIRFAGGLSAQTAANSSSSSSLDLVITYQVASSNAQAPLTGLGLSFNGQTFGSGIATASVTEDAFTALGGTRIGRTAVQAPDGPLDASVAFSASVASAYVVKDIVLTANPGRDVTQAVISFVDQTFTGGGGGGGGPGTGTPVPEPISLVVLGTGLVGLGLMRRAKRG